MSLAFDWEHDPQGHTWTDGGAVYETDPPMRVMVCADCHAQALRFGLRGDFRALADDHRAILRCAGPTVDPALFLTLLALF